MHLQQLATSTAFSVIREYAAENPL
uniref:Uncharacterized protein n=1 Tax=Anguilla anguilla TaxID=7936 RepID=A0A0E9R974_ANGAN